MDCIPNADNTKCANCGWAWTHPEICEWPRRNCTGSKEVRILAEELGLKLPEQNGLLPFIGSYIAGGCRDRPESEQEPLKIICRGVSGHPSTACSFYGHATDQWPEQCLWGCPAGGDPKREIKPPLAVLWRLASYCCSHGYGWPESA